ncbi:MAG TPA: hypothetical protein VHN15_08550, partial [Thermoanaerobaculia bacterium]|nr:hypothetical protein [Thermoanaerobaculia bacterium]
MTEEPQEKRDDERQESGLPDLGARIARRVSLPGVSTPGLDRDLAARGRAVSGGSLAAEIRRRWLPAAAAGGGVALPYFGGWQGGTGDAAAGGFSGTQGRAGGGGGAPVARAVARPEAAATPAAQAAEALSGLGTDLQRRHSAGVTGGGMVQRRTAPAPAATAPAASSPAVSAPAVPVASAPSVGVAPAGPGGGALSRAAGEG